MVLYTPWIYTIYFTICVLPLLPCAYCTGSTVLPSWAWRFSDSLSIWLTLPEFPYQDSTPLHSPNIQRTLLLCLSRGDVTRLIEVIIVPASEYIYSNVSHVSILTSLLDLLPTTSLVILHSSLWSSPPLSDYITVHQSQLKSWTTILHGNNGAAKC